MNIAVSFDEEEIKRDFREFVMEFLRKHHGDLCAIPAQTLINRFVYTKSRSPVSGKHRYRYLDETNMTLQRFYGVLREMVDEGVIMKEQTTHKLKIMAVPA